MLTIGNKKTDEIGFSYQNALMVRGFRKGIRIWFEKVKRLDVNSLNENIVIHEKKSEVIIPFDTNHKVHLYIILVDTETSKTYNFWYDKESETFERQKENFYLASDTKVYVWI